MNHDLSTISNYCQSIGFLILCVCIGMPKGSLAEIENERYVQQGQIVYDKQSDLSWTRCSIGQEWAPPANCIGAPAKFSFVAAQKLSKKEWRVPTKAEIATLIEPQKAGAKIDEIAFPCMKAELLLYWTNDQSNNTNAWFADFHAGVVSNIFGDSEFLSYPMLVRLVHAGKIEYQPVTSLTSIKTSSRH